MLLQRLGQRGDCHQLSLKEEQDEAHVLQGPAVIGPHKEEHAWEPSWLGSFERNEQDGQTSSFRNF